MVDFSMQREIQIFIFSLESSDQYFSDQYILDQYISDQYIYSPELAYFMMFDNHSVYREKCIDFFWNLRRHK